MTIQGAAISGINGMIAFSSAIGNISENLANTSTVGYKQVDTNFQDMISGFDLAYPKPQSVQSQPTYANDLAGSIVSTGINTNFAIEQGSGFASVKQLNTAGNNVDSSAPLDYTQAGDFAPNANGYLVNSAGYVLMGVASSSPFSNSFPDTVDAGSLTPVQVGSNPTMPGAASTTINFDANFPADAPVGSGSDQTTSLQVYDSLGSPHTLQLTFQKTAADTWQATNATVEDDPPVTASIGNAAVNFDSNGRLTSSDQISISASGLSGGGSLSGLSINMGTPTTQSTQWTGETMDVRSTTDLTGHATGTYQSASIDKNGYVDFNYSNGQVVQAYRIPLATFTNPDDLQRVTGSVFGDNPTMAGTASMQWSGQNNAGTIDPGSVEQSNVDIVTELTKMISAQNFYSSNSKVVSATNEMTQTTIDLKT